MAGKSKGDSGKKPEAASDQIGEPQIVSSSVSTPSDSDVWAKLLDQSPWTAKPTPRNVDTPVITQRVSRPQVKPDDSLLWADQVWKKTRQVEVEKVEPVTQSAEPSLDPQPVSEPIVVSSTPLVIEVPHDPAAITVDEVVPEPVGLASEAVDIIELEVLNVTVEPHIVEIEVEDTSPIETTFEAPSPAEPEVVVADVLVQPDVVEPEITVQPQTVPPPQVSAADLLAARMAEVAAIKAAELAKAAAAEPVPSPEAAVFPVEETLTEEAPIAEPQIEDNTVEAVTESSPSEPVILPLTPPPITPYFERFAGSAPSFDTAASPFVAAKSESGPADQREIPVEDLVTGVVNILGTGVSGAVSLGSKAVGGLLKGGSTLGAFITSKASKLGCGTCGTTGTNCEK